MEKYEKLIEDICFAFNLRKEHILSKRRDKRLIEVKKLIYWILRNEGLSFPQIGKLMNKDHSTILKVLRGME